MWLHNITIQDEVLGCLGVCVKKESWGEGYHIYSEPRFKPVGLERRQGRQVLIRIKEDD